MVSRQLAAPLLESAKAHWSATDQDSDSERIVWLQFLPAMIVWPIWIYIMASGNYWEEVFYYWRATVAMILGSFVAGSTPLGGGVVAFPLSVLVFKFTPQDSRDTSVLVQAVGMNAAAFLLMTKKPHLLHARTISINVLFGSLGMLIAVGTAVPSYELNLLYTLLIFEFAVVYIYTNIFVRNGADGDATNRTAHSSTSINDGAGMSSGSDGQIWGERLVTCSMPLLAVFGGYLTGYIGSGSDIVVYGFGLYVWNAFLPQQAKSDNVFTASSVVVMGAMCLLTAITICLRQGFSRQVLLCWGAMIPAVVLGAPLGSLVLKPAALPYLRVLFYVMAVTQLVFFAVLKIKDNVDSWIAFGVLTAVVLGLLSFHWYRSATINKQTQW